MSRNWARYFEWSNREEESASVVDRERMARLHELMTRDGMRDFKADIEALKEKFKPTPDSADYTGIWVGIDQVSQLLATYEVQLRANHE